MVTSLKIDEKKMGYRGSKSVLVSNTKTVKEQRVDGSWDLKKNINISNNKSLRCTLTGFERNYPVKNPSKQLNKLFFSTMSTISGALQGLNPYFVTGFTDGEGCFCTSIYKDEKYKTGWHVRSFFEISLNKIDRLLLLQIQEFFGGIGIISPDKTNDTLNYSVNNLKDLTTIIIPHFKKYQLITQKAADFQIFEKIVEIMSTGGHLTLNGLQEIINLKASMNLGLTDIIKSEFSIIKPVERVIIQTTKIPDPNWISGFVNAEGNFDPGIKVQDNCKTGFQVYLRFRVTQHVRDTKLMELLIKYFGAGRIENSRQVVNFVVGNFSDLTQIIIPFFKKYPLVGIKQLDYLDWCKIANLMTLRSHLKPEGLEEIRILKAGMNTGRKEK
jgi:LAGLIDADG endonuclease